MINQINNLDKNTFAPLQNSMTPYAIAKPFTVEQKKEYKKQIEADSENKVSNIGLKVVKFGFLAVVSAYLLLKGVPKKWHSKIDQAQKNLVDMELDNSKPNSGLGRKVRLGARRILANAKAIFNLAPLKDVLISKAIEKSPFWNNIGNKVTDFYEKISVKTVNKSYRNTAGHIDTMLATFEEESKKLSKSDEQIVKQKIANIRKVYTEGFSESARRARLEDVKRDFDGYNKSGHFNKENRLMEKVWSKTYKDLKAFLNSDKAYTTFISEELAARTKLNNSRKINSHQVLISNSLNTICQDSFDLLMHVDTFLDPRDPARKVIKKIVNPLIKYQDTLKKGGEAWPILLNSEIPNNLKKLDNMLKKSSKYDERTIEEVSKTIEQVNYLLENDKRGEVQQIMVMLKKNMSEKDIKNLDKVAYKATESLERSTDIESDKLFDKIRDLKIGSAPKDTLAVLASLGIVGFELSKADNADERASVAIKYGIPTLGAVIITLYCTVGLVSAGPSLLIGLASGFAMNEIGTSVDKFRKKYKDGLWKTNSTTEVKNNPVNSGNKISPKT